MWCEGGNADAIIEAKGLKQVSDSGAIEALVDEIIAANADKVGGVSQRQGQAVRLLRRPRYEGQQGQG